MTSSAFWTRANNGSELKLRGAGQTVWPGAAVCAAAATRDVEEIADKVSPAKASRTAARSRPRVTILTTLPSKAPADDLSGLAIPGLAGRGSAARAVSSDSGL